MNTPGTPHTPRIEVPFDADHAQQAVEYGYVREWSDGLPLVPVTPALVDRFLATTPRDPAEVIGRMEHLGRSCTVELAAVNAAMAGCVPAHFPVVLAAWDALMLERAARGGAWQSTSGPSPLIVVNGPIRKELGFNSTGGALGPGFRANATVARALGLIVRNAFGLRPHGLEQSTQGVPGRWTLCIGENEEDSPWEPLAASTGLGAGTPDAVTATLLRTCAYVDNRHTADPEQVLWDLADAMSATGSIIFRHTACALVLGPDHARMLADAGYGRRDVQQWLYEHAGRTVADLRRAGKDGVGEDNGVRHATGTTPDAPGGEEFVRFLPSPESIPVLVAGAHGAAMSMVGRIFGAWSGTAVPVVRSEPDPNPLQEA
ncbi:hypothetical protein [Streptomyces sp. NRRL S-813]|uniref:hypothetical protein n=1 Tax=Streptomyces sp. NRRL S-813 TaxID=1463919 RepID=UPI000B3026A2|nr:hypothetical protein [Streptomyces sp. NRRL S-813]